MNHSNPAEPNKVVLFGGSFDPPHLGHAMLVQLALAKTNLPVLVCPAAAHAFDKSLTPWEHRLKMSDLAFRHLRNVDVLSIEADLASQKTPSYAINLVEALQERNPGLKVVWLMGVDTYEELDRWHRHEDLRRKVEFMVYGREEKLSPQGLPNVLPVASSKLRTNFKVGRYLEARKDLDLQVYNYIMEKRLYQ